MSIFAGQIYYTNNSKIFSKMKNNVFVLILAMIFGLSACNNGSSEQSVPVPEGNYKVTIKEVVQATSYTYLRVEEFGSDYWIAVNKGEFKSGETVYYANRMEMHNFESKDLGRTFETIYFVQDISNNPIIERGGNMPGAMGGMGTEATKPVLNKIDVEIELPDGAVTIGELWGNKDSFAGKEVTVRGKVTKVNASIMSRNWIHIQDGTGDDSNFDLTITSNDLPEVGDVVTFKGTIATEKDFGYGYAYDMMMEEAKKIGD